MRACYAPPRAAQRFSFRGFWSIGKKEMTTDQPSARVQPKGRFSLELERREAIGYDGAERSSSGNRRRLSQKESSGILVEKGRKAKERK